MKEIGRGGQRYFVVCSKETFWGFYQSLPLADKKHYEVLIAGHEVLKWFESI